MYEILQYAIAGGSVGFVVGMTGVGGGSFMTPILLAFGFQPAVAIGTDLLYAAITKAGGVASHWRQHTINWNIVLFLAIGSVPTSIGTMFFLKKLQEQNIDYSNYLTISLGIMLTLTSIVLFFRSYLLRERHQLSDDQSALGAFERRYANTITVIMGVALGALVTLSSVGAGAFAAAVLLILYPRMAMIRIIGTDLAHAVPLTAVAGIGHILLNHVDFFLLGGLLIGSLPGIWLGTKLAKRAPEKIMQKLMASVLLLLGLNYTFF